MLDAQLGVPEPAQVSPHLAICPCLAQVSSGVATRPQASCPGVPKPSRVSLHSATCPRSWPGGPGPTEGHTLLCLPPSRPGGHRPSCLSQVSPGELRCPQASCPAWHGVSNLSQVSPAWSGYLRLAKCPCTWTEPPAPRVPAPSSHPGEVSPLPPASCPHAQPGGPVPPALLARCPHAPRTVPLCPPLRAPVPSHVSPRCVAAPCPTPTRAGAAARTQRAGVAAFIAGLSWSWPPGWS